MKKIIAGTRYNTETAIEVGTYEFGSYPQSGDFSHWEATLYKTPRSGRFFIHGRGGAMTRFATHSPYGGTCGGEKLVPMDQLEALKWAENFLDADAIEKHFSELIIDA